MTMLGQSGNPNREVLFLATAGTSVAADNALTYVVRTAGLPRFRVVVERTAGSVASTFTVSVRGSVGGDAVDLAWPVAPLTAIPAAALGQVVVTDLTGIAHDVVFVTIANDNATGPTTLRVQLMATFT